MGDPYQEVTPKFSRNSLWSRQTQTGGRVNWWRGTLWNNVCYSFCVFTVTQKSNLIEEVHSPRTLQGKCLLDDPFCTLDECVSVEDQKRVATWVTSENSTVGDVGGWFRGSYWKCDTYHTANAVENMHDSRPTHSVSWWFILDQWWTVNIFH